MSYEPIRACRELGIPIRRMRLRDTWGAWVPQYETIVLAEGLGPIQERCVLAHELEHALSRDVGPCGCGPYAERTAVRNRFTTLTRRQESRADRRAARKLIEISELAEAAQWAFDDLTVLATHLRVTERMLRIRLADMPEEGWPWPLAALKIAG